MWAIYVFASLLVLPVLALCIPLDITISFDTRQKPKFSTRLRWLFGLVTSELAGKEKPADHKPRPERKKLEFSTMLDILRTKGLARQFLRLIKRIFRRIKIRELAADLKIGLENPADLGLLFAFLAPLNLLIQYFSPHQIVLQPNFTEEVFLQGHAHATARLQPILLVPLLAGFAFSRPGFTTARKLILARWK